MRINDSLHPARQHKYRVWLLGYGEWQPRSWFAVPPTAVALRPAHAHALSRRQAVVYVEAFNRRMLARPKHIWAVAVPVTVHYEGDLRAGQTMAAAAGNASFFIDR